MMSELDPVMKKEQPKIVRTRDNLYDFFISRARANLHIALCFSPVSKTLHAYDGTHSNTAILNSMIRRLVRNSVLVP